MSFRIDPRKPLDNEVHRIGTELIDDAIALLSNQPDGPHAAVHGARKKFKRLRALYRFVQSEEPKFRSTENLRFRDIARSLSQARDAAALVETIHYLQNFASTDNERQALTAAETVLASRRDALTGDEGDFKARIDTAIAECEAGKEALAKLSLPTGAKTAVRLVRQTWRRQRKKALTALQQCHERAHDESFHDLRKSGQVYWMHLALLRRVWPSALRAKKVDAKRLVDLLGHEHDLSVLAAFADREPEHFAGGDTLTLLLDTITRRQQALRQDCLDLADHVFAESSGAESRIIAALWEHAAR
ncbi:CHAD domain-containing protein [Agrobacterium vaccinii]|uniref:CHAD domain-containing protein n=1 Tax=Agrobacterium vaccinii TaxID=2735528 RepID=UPI001E4A8AAD|nr:CHAD domain-containing protein [Agrobacterium vaccinii]UHS62297.1 CHAD domain-containing protein [Agrobacterium vaccinii]